MNYNLLPYDVLDTMDFVLPPGYSGNLQVLASGSGTKFYVGLNKAGRKQWIGSFFPKGTTPPQYLDLYADRFNAIAISLPNHAVFSRAKVQSWVRKATPGFLYCPEFYNSILQYRRYEEQHNHKTLFQFIEVMQGLGEHLGPYILRLAPDTRYTHLPAFLDFLKLIAPMAPSFLELRLAELVNGRINPELFTALKKMKIGVTIPDIAGHRELLHMQMTIPEVMVRFAASGHQKSDVFRIDQWVSKLKLWQELGLERCYFFIYDRGNGLVGPHLADYLSRQLNIQCNAGLKNCMR